MQRPMTSEKTVTICVPTFNAEQTLTETLDSILSQTHTNLKLIVVDNASTDRTCELVEDYVTNDKRVSLLQHSTNVGGEGNFSRCMQLATGDYTAIFHADDVYEPQMVERQVQLLSTRPQSAAVFTRASLIDDHGSIYGRHPCPEEIFSHYAGQLDLSAALGLLARHGNFFVCPSAMVRTGVYKSIGEWDQGHFGSSSDLDVWLRILQHSEITILPDTLIRYRVSPASFSYHYHFLRAERSDFYKVMDEYLFNRNKDLVNDEILLDYRFKNLKEDVGLGFNALVRNESITSRKFIGAALRKNNLIRLVSGTRWLKFLSIAIGIWILSFLPLPEFIRRYLGKLRFQRQVVEKGLSINVPPV